jgi:AcrR family transcriptional regulator
VESLPALRPPQQRRSRASFERVLEAGARLLEEEGYQAFTLAEVSQRAGVSIGAIYARIDAKETLVLAIHEREMGRIGLEHAVFDADAPWQGMSAGVAIEALVRELSALMLRNEAILRVFLLRAASDERIAAAGSRSSSELARVWETRALSYRGAFAHPDPELAVDVCFRLIYAAFIRRVLHGPGFESERPLSWDQLADELVSISQGYLLGAFAARVDSAAIAH